MNRTVVFLSKRLVSTCSEACAAIKGTVSRIGKTVRNILRTASDKVGCFFETGKGKACRKAADEQSAARDINVQRADVGRDFACETSEGITGQAHSCTAFSGKTTTEVFPRVSPFAETGHFQYAPSPVPEVFVGGWKIYADNLDYSLEPIGSAPTPVGMVPKTQPPCLEGLIRNAGGWLGSRLRMEDAWWRSGLAGPPGSGGPARPSLSTKNGMGKYRRAWPRGSPYNRGTRPGNELSFG